VQRQGTGQGLPEIFKAQQRIAEAKHNKTVCIVTNTTALLHCKIMPLSQLQLSIDSEHLHRKRGQERQCP